MSGAVRIIRISVADKDFARDGWRREHFVSPVESGIFEKLAAEVGWTTMRHDIDVPTDPAQLAAWLNTHFSRSGRP